MSRRVLVLGDDSRSCLAVVRSLGRKGIQVILGAQDPLSIVPHSRFVTAVIPFPPTDCNLEQWDTQLKNVLREQTFDLVIPTSDETFVPVASKRADFEPLAKIAIPDERAFTLTYCKQHTLAMASNLGVPIPTTLLVETPADLAGIHSRAEMHFPLIIKPVSSRVWAAGRKVEVSVTLVHDSSTLVHTVTERLSSTKVLIQSFFPGIGVGQEFLAHDGTILAAFQHERVHEPPGGGGSSYRKSVPLDPQMLACSQKMLSHLRWTGVAMVEYKSNPATGEFVLMEINGRFWGSLPLALAAGVDFPFALYQLLVDGIVPTPSPYRLGLYSRNLHKDVTWFLETRPVRSPISVPITRPRHQIPREILNLLRGQERWDELTLDDPLPGLVACWYLGCFLMTKISRVVTKDLRSRIASNPLSRRLYRAKFRRLLAACPRLLFVCRGNTCRSPFAELYACRSLNSLGKDGLEITSAGTTSHAQRESPTIACLVGREFGVNLDSHRSRVLQPELLQWAGAIVCMDFQDYRQVTTLSPHSKRKTFLLASFDGKANSSQIPDPWGKGVDQFRACYKRISSGVDGLIQALIG